MINTIKAILEFDISDDKKLDLIRTLVKQEPQVSVSSQWGNVHYNSLGEVIPLTYTTTNEYLP